MEQGAVNIAYDNAPETTKQVFKALENIGSAAEGVIIYADIATGQNVSAVWGDLSPETKIRIQSGGALVSLIVAPSVAKKLSNSTPNIKPKITTDFNIVAKNSAGLKNIINIPDNQRKINQITSRGWSLNAIQGIVDEPFRTRKAVNKANGNPATVYYRSDGHYIVRDDVTKTLVQMSDTKLKVGYGDSNWKPDNTIENPFIPD